MDLNTNLISRTHDNNIRMAGFLEKKGKMKLMTHWKKYWFVLEERLLLYYRSEIEYSNLSPCRGSLNMGLVSTVYPGSSSGPCIIHVITRTQVIQLRARNRAIQEKWLQALLYSMSLPVVNFPKAVKRPCVKTKVYGCSLDNIAMNERLHFEDTENDWTLPRKLDYRRSQVGGNLYGGSLDTAIWCKKFKFNKMPSPNISKKQFLEKILGLSKESGSLKNVPLQAKESRFSLCDEREMKYLGEELEYDKCEVHDENRNHDFQKRESKMSKTLSDTELNKTPYRSLEYEKPQRKNESPFVRIKNAFSRAPKDNNLKVEKRGRSQKKRRQSFLQRVFKKRDYENQDLTPDNVSDNQDPLYDTIEHIQEQNRNSIPVEFRNVEENQEPTKNLEALYAEVQKPVFGSKTILPTQTMSELKLKLKSRESLSEETRVHKTAPSLPPRRVSRPISPWHDVPTNNAPVGDAKSFYVHQAIVKFNDSIPPIEISEYSDLEDDLDMKNSNTAQEKKNDDLSLLLEQLTRITVAPLAEPELTDDNYNSSSESEKYWTKSQISEPDYDIPRPHRPLSIIISEGKEIISSTEFLGRFDNRSDTGSSFKSMEPDSLELAEKKSKFS